MHDGLAEVALHGDFNGVRDFRKASEKASASEPGEPALAVFLPDVGVCCNHPYPCRNKWARLRPTRSAEIGPASLSMPGLWIFARYK
jgi:hypothetical protein